MEDYSDSKSELEGILISLETQFESLKNVSREIKQSFIKTNIQLKTMYLDLLSNHLDVLTWVHCKYDWDSPLLASVNRRTWVGSREDFRWSVKCSLSISCRDISIVNRFSTQSNKGGCCWRSNECNSSSSSNRWQLRRYSNLTTKRVKLLSLRSKMLLIECTRLVFYDRQCCSILPIWKAIDRQSSPC